MIIRWLIFLTAWRWKASNLWYTDSLVERLAWRPPSPTWSTPVGEGFDRSAIQELALSDFAGRHDSIEVFADSLLEFSPAMRRAGSGDRRQGQAAKNLSLVRDPWEILRQLPDLARYLKPDLTVAVMNQRAGTESDTSSARRMQKEK